MDNFFVILFFDDDGKSVIECKEKLVDDIWMYSTGKNISVGKQCLLGSYFYPDHAYERRKDFCQGGQ